MVVKNIIDSMRHCFFNRHRFSCEDCGAFRKGDGHFENGIKQVRSFESCYTKASSIRVFGPISEDNIVMGFDSLEVIKQVGDV